MFSMKCLIPTLLIGLTVLGKPLSHRPIRKGQVEHEYREGNQQQHAVDGLAYRLDECVSGYCYQSYHDVSSVLNGKVQHAMVKLQQALTGHHAYTQYEILTGEVHGDK